MKNSQTIANKTKNTRSYDKTTWIPLFYSFAQDAVYTVPSNDRFQVTTLINPNTKEDIEQAVKRFINC